MKLNKENQTNQRNNNLQQNEFCTKNEQFKTSALCSIASFLISGKPDYLPPAPTEPRRGWGPSIMQD